MPNMSLKKVEMPVQDGEVRRNNFDEVTLGYTKEMAMEEAERCLHCPTKPCISGCPVSVNLKKLTRSFTKQALCLLFVDVYVLRKHNARVNVCVA